MDEDSFENSQTQMHEMCTTLGNNWDDLRQDFQQQVEAWAGRCHAAEDKLEKEKKMVSDLSNLLDSALTELRELRTLKEETMQWAEDKVPLLENFNLHPLTSVAGRRAAESDGAAACDCGRAPGRRYGFASGAKRGVEGGLDRGGRANGSVETPSRVSGKLGRAGSPPFSSSLPF